MEATPSVTRTGRGEDVEAGDPESEHQHQLQQSSSQSSPSRADKAVSTGDLGIGTAMLGAPLGDLLAALVETKACAIKAECERVNRRTSRAWRLLRLHRKEPQAQARVTPVVHHHHGHHHHHHHHHPLHHHHHHHHHHQQQPPITLHGSALSPTDGLVGACSPLEPCPLGGRGPLSPPGGPTSACSSDLVACTLPPPLDVTVTGMCTTSDAPGLPSDTTLSPPHPDADSDSDHQHALPPLPLDPPPSRPHPRSRRVPPPLRRTLSSRSHQYHNYDYSTAQVTSWSCSATPQGTPVGTPVAGTPLATPAGSAAPSRAPSPPTPPDPENHLHLLYHPRPADPPPDPPPEHDRPRPRRKKRRRRKAAAGAGGGGPGAAGARRGGAKGAKQHGGGGVKGGKRPPIRGPLAEDVRPRPLDPDELPKRARWTIAVTAGFLLILSMLLVGITLRMAPLIDEMVRQQNEEHRNMLNSSHALPAQNSSHRS